MQDYMGIDLDVTQIMWLKSKIKLGRSTEIFKSRMKTEKMSQIESEMVISAKIPMEMMVIALVR